MDDEFDIFDDDGELAVPTMRGNANLDVEDYHGPNDSFLIDGLQEDVPSTPGRNPGAAPATDIDGTSEFDMLSVPGGMDAPGMKQTTFGQSPWGPGSSQGYRPYSQERTGMDLRAMGDSAEEMMQPPAPLDSMAHEPEVINAAEAERPVSWDNQWHGEQNQQPSNAEIDPMTLYDRESYEYDDSSQDVIGSGIFGMEEGVTWRPQDGMFANNYAMPKYLAEEDELGVQQSDMWDSTAGEWRVTQPSAGGVPLARRINHLKPPVNLRPESTGPRSHIEAFGRKAAQIIGAQAKTLHPQHREQFLRNALDSLGPSGADKARKTAAALVKMGYRPDVAMEDAAAHLVMHAAMKDLSSPASKRGQLPHLDRMVKVLTPAAAPHMRQAAQEHVAPLVTDPNAAAQDVNALKASPAAAGMGQVSTEDAPPTPNPADKPFFTKKRVLIGGAVGLGAFFMFRNRKAIQKNLKRLVK